MVTQRFNIKSFSLLVSNSPLDLHLSGDSRLSAKDRCKRDDTIIQIFVYSFVPERYQTRNYKGLTARNFP